MFLRFVPRTFRVQMALLFGVISLFISLPAYFYISNQHKAQLIEYKRETLKGVTNAAATILTESLAERHREIVLLTQTPSYQKSDFRMADVRASLERVKQSYAHYSWIGIANAEGLVQSATSSHLEGADVSKRPWFQEGLKGPFVGDLHEALLLAKLLPNPSPNQPIRFIDFSAPIFDASGRVKGVLAAHAHWQWAGSLVGTMAPIHAQRDGIDLFILNHKGEVIYPEKIPEKLRVPSLDTLSNSADKKFVSWGEDKLYLTTSAAVKTPASVKSLGWQVVVRQVDTSVLTEVKNLERVNLFTMLTSSIAFLFLAWIVANRISRPVEDLTRTARRIESGEKEVGFAEKFWARELQRLSDALRGMSNTLIQQREALAQSNQELEAKVSARTAELQELNITLEQLARTDALTGLANRMHTNERLAEEFARFKRSKIPYCILMLDVDFFKRVNDIYGHGVGDEVLKHVASILSATVRKTDFVGRHGGEEFLSILPMTDSSAAMVVAEKIRNTIESTPIGPVGNLTVSIGVQEVTVNDINEDVAVTRADECMYQAKKSGRNKVISNGRHVALLS
ncbi:conserved hypothetical protein [Herminiimonas arsenicoxydans]|uniref:diguanylate cyclase n=1 Tax=Herminiimonas arsenicoxydans TaxID=204773 RepID=A4G383_HERAR|nr:conserved hypothetical protein [Herminiimonas arsenicoxydans]